MTKRTAMSLARKSSMGVAADTGYREGTSAYEGAATQNASGTYHSPTLTCEHQGCFMIRFVTPRLALRSTPSSVTQAADRESRSLAAAEAPVAAVATRTIAAAVPTHRALNADAGELVRVDPFTALSPFLRHHGATREASVATNF
jgi:hypothetical protein